MKMKHLFIVITSFFLLLSSSQLRADGHETKDDHNAKQTAEHDHKDVEKHDDEKGNDEEEESFGGVGKNNAVIAADEHEGIQLSAKSQNAIGLKSESFQNGSVPVSALVQHQNQISIYRLRDGWYKLVAVRIEKIENGLALIQSTEIKSGDFVVTKNVGLLRVAELDAFSSEVGHSH